MGQAQFNESGIGADKGVTFGIGTDALRPVDLRSANVDTFEFAGKPVQPKVTARQQGTVRRLAKRRTGVHRHSLGYSKGLEPFTVVPEDPVFRADPEKPVTILVDLPNGQICEAFSVPEVTELKFLTAKRLAHEKQTRERAHHRAPMPSYMAHIG